MLTKNGDKMLPKSDAATRATTKINEKTIVSSLTKTFFTDCEKKK